MNPRVCPDCGEALDADEQFCGNCGCYLDWTDAAEPEAQPEPVTVPETAPQQRGLAERVKSALGVGDAPPPPPPGPGPGGRPVPATPPVVERHNTAERPAAKQPAAATAGSGGAEALVVPVDQGGQPQAQQPRAQQPGRPTARPRRPGNAGPPEPLNPGDLVCGTCGTGNKPTRKFCRRCGHDLSEAEVAKVPWWKRILRRKPKMTEAGTRPRSSGRRRGVPVRLFVLLGVVGALGIGGYAARGILTDGVELVRDRISGVEPIKPRPADVTGSSSQPGHGPGEVRDTRPEEYWAPAKPGDGVGEYLEISFREPIRLVYLLITPGASPSDEDAFVAQGRPEDLRIIIDREGAATEVETVHLEDKRGPVEVGIAESDVTKIRIEIAKAYAGNAPDSRTAIGEIEFWVRK